MNTIKEIRSAQNPEVKWIRKLKRQRDSHFLVEGPKLLSQAVSVGMELETLWMADEHETAVRELGFKTSIRRVPASVYDSISPTKVAQGPIGVFRRPERFVKSFEACTGRFLLLDHVQDPGNAGALIRAAAAFGLDGLVWFGDHPDLFHHALIRGSAGTVFSLNHFEADLEALEAGPPLLGTDATRGRELPAFKWPDSFLICLGNEGHGLTPNIEGMCSDFVSIPISPNVESLNVAGAAHVLLYSIKNPLP